MMKLLSIVTWSAFALALPMSGFAAEKKAKKEAAPAPAATELAPTDGAKKPANVGSPKTGAAKAIGMYVKIDAIDAKAKTFSHMNKPKGTEAAKEVKFVITDKTEIKNGEAPAKFADLKVGDTVSGSRMKKSDTEYEVVKITKFGIAAPKEKKPEGDKKPGEAKKP